MFKTPFWSFLVICKKILFCYSYNIMGWYFGIDVYELLKIKGANIIDIRSVQKYNDNHIPGSINIEYNKLLGNSDKYIRKDDTYYIYCQKGVMSKRVVNYLRSLGYNVYDVIGGYESYILNKFKNY